MTIKKLEDGQYEVDIRPNGRSGRRIRRKFSKKQEAIAFERYVSANHRNKEWLARPADKRKLSELINLWWQYHGRASDHGQNYRLKLQRFSEMTGDPAAFQIDRNLIARYKALRMQSGVKASTINREMTTISGAFTQLIDSGVFHGEHPIRGTGTLKEEVPEMSFLYDHEITALLAMLEGDNKQLAVLMLSTGGRWGESQKLKSMNIVHQRVTFTKTKTSRLRSVPISVEVAEQVTKNKTGLLFPDADYKTFRLVLKSVKPDLPSGQATHVLRHTFATHFMMNGGNIVTLQRVLGHTKITQTMVYAHFAPDYLSDVIRMNPLRGGTDMTDGATT